MGEATLAKIREAELLVIEAQEVADAREAAEVEAAEAMEAEDVATEIESAEETD